MNKLRVWITGWEWECCGDPFKVGSTVLWHLYPVDEDLRSFLTPQLGTQVVEQLTHAESHHFLDEDEEDVKPQRTRARVEGINAVYWVNAPRPEGDPVMHYPVPGTGSLQKLEAVTDGFEEDSQREGNHEGYIVELTPIF